MATIKKYQAGGKASAKPAPRKMSRNFMMNEQGDTLRGKKAAKAYDLDMQMRRDLQKEKDARMKKGVKFNAGGRIKKAQAGLNASNKRVGPVDPNGAWTKVQMMNLPPRNVKTKVSLTQDKEQGATSMTAKRGKKIAKAKGGKWIQSAIKKPGALRSALGVKKGQKIPAGKLAAAAKKPGKMGQRARLAQTLGKMRKK
tara:strand:+ start:1314 stop:1907 length:594 start_codon:yes stop_codon:yes gene_type:complete